MPAHSAWLQMLWEKLNHDLFSGKLTIPNEIDWVPGLPAEARYYSERNIIVLDASRYTIELVMKQHNIGRTTPNDDEWNQFFEVLYLLIHEMVHQYIAQQGSGSTKHDAEFVNVANSLPRTPEFDLPNCDVNNATHWPMISRNANIPAIDSTKSNNYQMTTDKNHSGKSSMTMNSNTPIHPTPSEDTGTTTFPKVDRAQLPENMSESDALPRSPTSSLRPSSYATTLLLKAHAIGGGVAAILSANFSPFFPLVDEIMKKFPVPTTSWTFLAELIAYLLMVWIASSTEFWITWKNKRTVLPYLRARLSEVCAAGVIYSIGTFPITYFHLIDHAPTVPYVLLIWTLSVSGIIAIDYCYKKTTND